ncbi:RNA polymerase sigma-70 factor, sigma-B/F/G subfamily [Christensenella minuta]|jgi:RNA polymerase sigma-B factor|uniref:RNA polymerase sigma-70 factor, sigma-B/F/G subfamily n=2 Tax=Christensenella minuta TaxID=626937 RepID=A0A136Q2B6_9FIRM|nr:RNA polymerase sigma-70 factor, sigma-B/F/G subfamily [Christensenella minuta]
MDSDELFKLYVKNHDVDIRNILIERYLYIAEIAAKKFAGRGVDYEDLFQVASLALVKAIERFEPEREIKFSSYATPSLIGEIKNYFRDSSRVMRLPRRDTEQLKKIKLYTQEYMARNGKKPSPREIAEEMDLSVERVLEVLEMQQADNILSLDSALAADSENFSLGNVLGQEDASFEHVENHDFINYCMSLLNDTEKKIIEQRYLGNKTQKQVADMLNVSQMQVSRMERKILNKLAMVYKK